MSALTDPRDLGTVLAVFAHPDDEAYLAGGIMAACADAGQRVVCVTATRGELGTPDPEAWPPARMAVVREAELAACLEVLGVREHHWLGVADGACADVDPEPPLAALTTLVGDVRPDTVLTFGPDGMTWHPDHIVIGEWAAEAVRRAGSGARVHHATQTPESNELMRRHVDLNLVMMADKPPPETAAGELAVHVRLDDAALERKVAALRCQSSQVAPFVRLVGLAAFGEIVREEAYVLAATRR